MYSDFARRHRLKPADVVVTPKSFMGFAEHYLVYMGRNEQGQEFYIENSHESGVRWLSGEEFEAGNPKYKRIRRFGGDEHQRQQALQRAQSELGRSYNLLMFNCENFVNYVQFGIRRSRQVNNALLGISTVAAIGLVLPQLQGRAGRN